MQAGLQKKKKEVTSQTFMMSSSPVAAGAEAVIALAAFWRSEALVTVPKSCHAALMVGFLSKGCLKTRAICNVFPALQGLKKEISQFTIYFTFKKRIYYTFELSLSSLVS